jgi:hypothetical protein
MRKTWKTPEILRLSRIEERYRDRFERALREADQATAYRAMERYVAVAARADGIALSAVSPYQG